MKPNMFSRIEDSLVGSRFVKVVAEMSFIVGLIVILAALAVITTGCASASYDRKLSDGSEQKTSIHTFLSTTAIKNFSESIKDGTGTNSYSRSVRVADAATQTEIEKLGPLLEAAMKGVAEGAVKGAAPH